MRRLDPLSQTKPRELDRKMWADIDRLMYKFQAKGRGEYFFDEPIFFGTAFTAPPVLSYSSTTDGFEGEPVIPYRIVPPKDMRKDVDIYHLTNHSLGGNVVIADPGFEVQGVWIPLMGDEARYIPVTSDVVASYYSNFDTDGVYIGPPGEEEWWRNWPNVILGVWVREGYSPQNWMGRRHPGWANNWIQTDEARGRWTVSDDMSHDYGVGFRGKYSAKFTFVDGGSSTWMMSMGWSTSWPEQLGGHNPELAHWGFTSLVQWCEWYGTQEPPLMQGWNGSVAVWSDEDCEIDLWQYKWWWNQDWYHTRTDLWDYRDMPYSYEDPTPMLESQMYYDYYSEYSGRWIRYDDIPHLQIAESRVTVPVIGGQWNDLSFYHPHGREQWSTAKFLEMVSGPGEMYETFRFRISGGSPGQTVHVDNFYVWPDIKNVYVPMVTIGVAEWVQDEQGAYIGAKLWVKVGDP